MPRYDFDLLTIGAGSGGVAGTRRAGSLRRQASRSRGIAASAAPACCAAACRKSSWSTARNSPRRSPTPPASAGPCRASSLDWTALIAAKDKEIDRLNGIYINLLNKAASRSSRRAARWSIRTASRSAAIVHRRKHPDRYRRLAEVPHIPGIEHVITSNEALDLRRLPRRIVIAGGGYIAVEFAGIFNGLGSEVVEIIRAEKLLRGFDEDIRDLSRRGDDGRAASMSAPARQVERSKRPPAAIRVTHHRRRHDRDRLVMYATGREPNTEGIGLAERVAIATERARVMRRRMAARPACPISTPSAT